MVSALFWFCAIGYWRMGRQDNNVIWRLMAICSGVLAIVAAFKVPL